MFLSETPTHLEFMRPEYVHLLLNHIPIIGLAFAIIPLLLGLIKNNSTTLLAGLLIAVLSGWTTPLVMDSGERAYERYKQGVVTAFLDKNVEEVLETHEHRAEAWSKVLYATAIVATLTLLVYFFRPNWIRWASIAVILLCIASTFAGIWIAKSGGEIRRPDFRHSVEMTAVHPK
jgi:Na+/H+-translocating membrane pyrophosphatase